MGSKVSIWHSLLLGTANPFRNSSPSLTVTMKEPSKTGSDSTINEHSLTLDQRSANSSYKGSILDFEVYMVYMLTTKLSYCNRKQPWTVCKQMSMTGFQLHCIFKKQEAGRIWPAGCSLPILDLHYITGYMWFSKGNQVISHILL